MRGGAGPNRWLRPLTAGIIALLVLLLLLSLLDQAGGHVRSSDVVGAFAVALVVGAMLA